MQQRTRSARERATRGLIGMALAAGCALPAAADIVSHTTAFTLDTFTQSSEGTGGFNIFWDAVNHIVPALPAAATFTLPTGGYIPLAQNEGRFVRLGFDLPTGYSNFALTLQTIVNDEFAVYLNDTVVAVQASIGVENFFAPLPGFVLDAAGNATDTSIEPGSGGKLEYLMSSGMQGLLHAGHNELTLFGTDTYLYGSIASLDGSLSYDAPSTQVPEPGLPALLGLGMAGLVMLRRRGKTPIV